jgi:hypothetical protein
MPLALIRRDKKTKKVTTSAFSRPNRRGEFIPVTKAAAAREKADLIDFKK